MRFTLIIDCDNDAFCDGDGRPTPDTALSAVGWCLENVKLDVATDDARRARSGYVRDPNGNRVGRWFLD